MTGSTATVRVVRAGGIGLRGPAGEGNTIWMDDGTITPERSYVDVIGPHLELEDVPGSDTRRLKLNVSALAVLAGGLLPDSVLSSAIARITDITAALAAHDAAADPHPGYVLESTANLANGYLRLDGTGLIPTSTLPALAIGETFTAASQAAMLALTAQTGDLCIRTDLNPNVTYVLAGSGNPATLADWIQVTFGGAVTSVNGQTGVIVLTAADVSAIATSARGAANGVAPLDGTSKVPTANLPTIPIAGGGTGQTAAAAAFDALAPTTTKGDLIARGASGNVRRAVSATDGDILGALASDASGLSYFKNGGALVVGDVGLFPITNMTNTTTRTKIWEITIPAGLLNKLGNILRWVASGTYLQNAAANVTHLVEVEVTDGTNSRIVASAATNVAQSATAKPYRAKGELHCRAAGATGTVISEADWTFFDSADGTMGGHMTNWPKVGRAAGTLDFTAALTFRLWLTWGTASASLALNTGGGLHAHHLYAR